MITKYVRLDAGEATSRGCAVTLQVNNSKNTQLQVKGTLDKWTLYHLARNCIEAMGKIRDAEAYDLEQTTRLLKELGK